MEEQLRKRNGRCAGKGVGAQATSANTAGSYFSESRAIRALSKVSFPGPWERPGAGFTSPAGPVGSKPSGTWGAMPCGLSSSESSGPAALQGEGDKWSSEFQGHEQPPYGEQAQHEHDVLPHPQLF